MKYNLNEVMDKLIDDYKEYYATHLTFSKLRDEYENIKNTPSSDYKIIKKQRDAQQFKLMKIHTRIEQRVEHMMSLYNDLPPKYKTSYTEDYEKLLDKYDNLKKGAIQYRRNITIPHYIKRNIQKYNIRL